MNEIMVIPASVSDCATRQLKKHADRNYHYEIQQVNTRQNYTVQANPILILCAIVAFET